jgi:hypothetical protein
MTYESPTYEVDECLGDVEIRHYEPYVVAETLVRGSLEKAGNGGFRVLAGYIFGGNETDAGDSTKISMTTPVTQDQVGDRYRIRFMMPTRYTTDSLPTPKDERVTVREVGPQRLAAIRYSGRWSRAEYERPRARLVRALDDAGYEAVGEPIWARYDPPWKPWFLRRNEVLTAVREMPDGAGGPG